VADEAFTAFVQTHGATLLRFAYLLCRDSARAEDFVQDALIKMLRRWRSAGVAAEPVAYARKVVVNEFLGWRRLRASTEVYGDVEVALADETEVISDRDLMWRLIGTLAPRARAVLVLRYYEQLPDAEIAALLGCAEATVRSIAARALTALRAQHFETKEA
jgi:RNA polymerase sigma-70 factor (sigma-E family)